MASAREQLLSLLAIKSFKLGEFKLSSGGTSDYYIDCRTTTLDAQGARLVGEVFLQEIRQHGWKPQAIGGMTMGADPIAVSVAIASGDIHAFLVRKAEKQHGTAQRIEGFRERGASVVIVDDVCTTGSSTVQAIEAARQAGLNITGVMCLVERTEANGRPNVEKAAAPAPFLTVFTDRDVREQHLRMNAAQPESGGRWNMIGKLGFFMFVVKDMDRATQFYRDVLGLKVSFQSPGWTALDAGNINVGLHSESEHLKVHPTESAQCGFYVDDIQKAISELKTKGVHILMPPKKEDFGWLAVFQDPDGYHLQLCQVNK